MSSPSSSPLSLDAQLAQFRQARFLAMPIAGTIAWVVIGVASLFLNLRATAFVLFAATGGIFYLGLLVAKVTGEDMLGRSRPGNFFDRIFLLTVAMAAGVYAIAIPFFLVDPTSLPLTVGILTGLMWIPFSALMGHWVGYFHGITRTVLIVAAWYLFPAQRFVVIPAVIVAVYLVSIYVLVRRPRT